MRKHDHHITGSHNTHKSNAMRSSCYYGGESDCGKIGGEGGGDADWYRSTTQLFHHLEPLLLMQTQRTQHPSSSSSLPSFSPSSSSLSHNRNLQQQQQRSPLRIVVQCDDYHYWEGCRKAVDEWRNSVTMRGAMVGGGPSPRLSPLHEVDGNAVIFTIDHS